MEKEHIHDIFLKKVKENLIELEEILTEVNGHWQYEDLIYRFYHCSYKVFWIQNETQKMLDVLEKLKPDEKCEFNDFFKQILIEGTGKQFHSDTTNKNWLAEIRPMLEAFFHCKYFIEMAVKYGKELEDEKAPECMPSGWAGLLYLYDLRYCI